MVKIIEIICDDRNNIIATIARGQKRATLNYKSPGYWNGQYAGWWYTKSNRKAGWILSWRLDRAWVRQHREQDWIELPEVRLLTDGKSK